jgi:hypothetical protein
MGDVIREFVLRMAIGHISWTNAIRTSKFGFSQLNLSPFRLTPLSTHFVIGRKSRIETIVNGILHRPHEKSLLTRLINPLFRRFLDDACCRVELRRLSGHLSPETIIEGVDGLYRREIWKKKKSNKTFRYIHVYMPVPSQPGRTSMQRDDKCRKMARRVEVYGSSSTVL